MIWIESSNNIIRIFKAYTFFRRLRGLIGKKELQESEAMLIRPCSNIHTCFMKFPIDVIFLDDRYRVIDFSTNVRPWHFSGHIKRAYQVLELKSGAVNKLGIEKGMILTISEPVGQSSEGEVMCNETFDKRSAI